MTKYKVKREFTGKDGQKYAAGREYTSQDEAETQKQLQAGNIEQDPSTGSGSGSTAQR